MTRRSLLATGGLAGAAVAAGIRPWSPAQAQAATSADTPSYLIRSSYQSLSTQSFGASLRGQSSDLTLQAVEDLPAAAGANKALAGSEDAFSLSFSSSTPLGPEIHTFSHPDLGVFDLFIAPIERQGSYEVVVKPPPGAPKPPKQLVRRLSARRVGHAVVAEITFEHSADLKWAALWLSRHGVVVSTAKHVRGRHASLRLPFHKRPRGGHYELTLGTMDRHGNEEYKTARIALQ